MNDETRESLVSGVQWSVPFHCVVPIMNPNDDDEAVVFVACDGVPIIVVLFCVVVGGRKPTAMVNDASIGVTRWVAAEVAVRHKEPSAK